MNRFALAFGLAMSSALPRAADAGAPPTLSPSTLPLRVSSTAPGNLLPAFRFQLSQVEGGSTSVAIGGGLPTPGPFVPGDSCPELIFDHASADLHAPNLPYLTQDRWDCARSPQNVSVLAYEDAFLRLAITPQWNGRIWSVHDKARGRDWTFANPAHQPANIAVLKSWTAGGIEWNWSPGIIGHSVFSESPSFVGVLNTTRGPVVRVWEYDRLNASVFQVDILLQNGALFVHPKVTHTRATAEPLQGYWWTCVAVPSKPSTRVITPASFTAQTSVSPTTWSTWPNFAMGDANSSFAGYLGRRITDNSFLGAVTSGDFFMGPTAPGEHSITYAEASGFAAYHGHAASLNGTKFFTWGQNGAGRFMQDFLGGISGPDFIPDDERAGDYAELQVGPAFTQMQTFDVPSGAPVQWTESFSALDGDPAVLLGDDYEAAVGAVAAWRASAASNINDSVTADVDAFLTALADTPVDAVLSTGSPWGAVELARRAAASDGADLPFPPGVTFTVPDSGATEAAPWLELVSAAGTFSAATLAVEPTSYQVSPEWLAILRNSSAVHGDTWLHALHTAVILAEMGGVDEPRALLAASLASRPSAVAARCLAVLQGSSDAARPLFRQAWATALGASADPSRERLLLNLASETVNFELGLAQHGTDPAALAELQGFLAALPAAGVPAALSLDSVLLATAWLAVEAGDWAGAVAVLTAEGAAGCFPTLASERSQLMDLWNAAMVLKAEEANGNKSLTAFELRNVRVSNPVPRNIGCPYGGGEGYPDCTYW